MYKTEKFGRVSAPMDIDIDISGGEWLKIQHAGTNEHRTQVILANFKLVESDFEAAKHGIE